jgi:branched-chain amino acid transport system ATP-binding protein
MSRSKLLLLDEPSMGLSPILVRDIFRVLREINAALAGDPKVRVAYLGG